MKKYLLIISCLLIISTSWSQDFKEILDSALQHPFLETQQKDIEIQKSLSKTGFDLAPTNIDYFFGHINEIDKIDYSLIVTQSFYLPTYYKRQTDLLKSNVSVQESEFILQKNEYIKNVKLAYYQLAFEQTSLLHYQDLDSLYTEMERVVGKQLDLGVIDYSIQANFILEAQQTHLLAHQKELAVQIALSQLQEFIPQKLTKVNTPNLTSLTFTKTENTSNPLLKLNQEKVIAQEKSVAVAKNELAIEWNAGYTNKLMADKIVSEYNVGISIPIIRKAQKAKIEAQKLSYQQSLLNQEAITLKLEAKIEQVYQQYLMHQESIVFYEKNALPLMEQLIKTAKIKYQNGEIDFLTYAQNLQKSIQIELNHLSAILLINQSVIELEYLTGKFQH